MDSPGVKVYGYRWVMLGAFMLVNVAMQMLWICFAPVTGPAASYYHVTDFEIGLLAISFMLVYIPLALPASWAIDTYGFRKAVGFGAILMGVFAVLRGLYTTNYTVTLLFTIGIAAGQPFLLNSWTKLAALWFPMRERATAVGLAAMATFLGIVIGQVLTPYLVLQFNFGAMQLIYGIATAFATVVFLVLAREHPPTPASPSGSEERALMLDGLKQILRQRNFYYLAFGMFVGGGVFNGLATWVESIVRPKGVSITDAGLLGGIMLIGGIVGAVAIPALSDRFRKRKIILLVGFALAIPGMFGVAFSADYAVLLASFFLVGLFTTGIGPVAYQYGAEITYPAPEGTSNGLFGLAGQLSVVMITAMGWIDTQFGSFTPSILALAGLMAAGCALMSLLKESTMMQTAAAPAP